MIEKFGYTRKEREQIINELECEKFVNNLVASLDGHDLDSETTEQQKQLKIIFKCASMLDSLFAYGHLEEPTDSLVNNSCLKPYVKLLGKDVVKKIIDEQRVLIKGVKQDVYEIQYNTLEYIDD